LFQKFNDGFTIFLS